MRVAVIKPENKCSAHNWQRMPMTEAQSKDVKANNPSLWERIMFFEQIKLEVQHG